MPLDYEQLVNRRHIRASRSRSPSVTRRDDYRRRISYIEDDLVAAVNRSFSDARHISRSLSNCEFGRSQSSHPQDLPPPAAVPLGPLPTRSTSAYTHDRSALLRESQRAYSQPQEPLRKYDVYGLRSWSYPIWKYLNTTYYGQGREPSQGDGYLRAHSYQPPLMTGDENRAYSGYAPLAGEHSYTLASPSDGSWYALHGYGTGYRRYHTRPPSEPWHRDYTSLGLRHFGSYRPRYVQHTVRPVWATYY